MKSAERLAMKLGLHPVGTRDPVSGSEGLIQIFRWELSLQQLRGGGVSVGSWASSYKLKDDGLRSKQRSYAQACFFSQPEHESDQLPRQLL